MASKQYPRDVAVRILTRVLSDHEALDEALAAVQGEIAPEARAWLQEICSGTLRWKGRIDFIIDSIALKKKPSGWLRKVISTAVYQLVAQSRTQPSRVVSETVDEVKQKEGEAPAKFANALLRKVADHAESWRELKPRFGAGADEAARWGSLPTWLWKALVKDHGEAWVREYAVASLVRPTLWIRSRATGPSPDWLTAGPIPGSFLVTGQSPQGSDLTQWPGFLDGDFFVQDISSQTLVDQISDLARQHLGPGTLQALDLCAAPGGKAMGMAWSGLRVKASDLDNRRMELLKQNIKRVAPEIEVIASHLIESLELQDLVWVDAPCSGTGILRRHPDVRWLRQEKEIPALLSTQQDLIKKGWDRLRLGGMLVYSVCSILKDEGPRALEKAGIGSHIIREWSLVPQVSPHGDGFWAAALIKS